MRCIKICPQYATHTVRVIVFGSKCCKHTAVYRFFASERREITTQLSDMIPNLANIMQFADVSFALLRNIARWHSSVQ